MDADNENRTLAGQMIEVLRQVARDHDFVLDTSTDRNGRQDYTLTVKFVRPNGSPPAKQSGPDDPQAPLPLGDDGLKAEVLDTVRTGLDDAAKEFKAPRARRPGRREGK